MKIYLTIISTILFSLIARCQSKNETDLILLKKQKISLENKIKIFSDSILLINEKIDNINNQSSNAFLKDSNNFILLKHGAKLRYNPDPLSKIMFEFKDTIRAKVLDFSDGYFGVCYFEKCGYLNEIWIINNDSITSRVVENYKLLNRKLVMEKEEMEKKAELKNAKIIEQKLIKQFGLNTYKKLNNGNIWIGMTKEMLIISKGNPLKVNRSVGSWGVSEQWVYQNNLYVYLKNGIVESYQD
jgi:hypothetical protein